MCCSVSLVAHTSTNSICSSTNSIVAVGPIEVMDDSLGLLCAILEVVAGMVVFELRVVITITSTGSISIQSGQPRRL